MQYPIPMVVDKTARDIEIAITKIAQERGMNADLLELSLYKVLAGLQQRKIEDYAESYIALMNNAAEKEKKEE